VFEYCVRGDLGLGQYTMVFQAKAYVIKSRASENIDKYYKKRNVCILSDSLVEIKAFGSYQISS
jgi:hypothetical protein